MRARITIFGALVVIFGISTLVSDRAQAAQVQCSEDYNILSGDNSLFMNGINFGTRLRGGHLDQFGNWDDRFEIGHDQSEYRGGTPSWFMGSVASTFNLKIDKIKKMAAIQISVVDGKTGIEILSASKTVDFSDHESESDFSILTAEKVIGDVNWVFHNGVAVGQPKVSIGDQIFFPMMDSKYVMGSGRFGISKIVSYKIDCHYWH